MSDQNSIPVDIDLPAQFLGKNIDEVAVLSMVIAMGFLTKMMLLSIVMAYLIGKAYGKLRGQQSNNFLFHLMYWYGLVTGKARSVPAGLDREFR